MSRLNGWLRRFRQGGGRLTRPRRAVIEVMATAEHALDPAAVFEQARERYPRLGLTTVYRTLDRLAELGLIQRIHGPEGCHAYVGASAGHEHVLLCESCGRATTFAGDELETLMRQVAARSGFQIHDHWLQFLGLCADCQPERADEGAALLS